MKIFLLTAYALLAVVISLLLAAPAKPAYSFFQSPVDPPDSPVATPTPEEPAEPTPAPPEEATPAPEPSATPAPTQPPAPTEAPPEQPPTATPIEVPPAATQPTLSPPLAPTLAPVDPDAPMVVNEVKLIDTVVQVLAWLWLCVGVSVILLALILFPFLQIRGSLLKRKNRDGE